jgi:hypothetical protein
VAHTVVFLWISAALGGNAANARSAAAEKLDHLRDFGAVRGLDFRPVVSESAPSLNDASSGGGATGAYDSGLADRLDAELEQARTALSALEEPAASARLARVESLLLAHPHLPQASFLMSECLGLQAQALRERAPARAAALEARRAALEGPRATAFGEVAIATGHVDEALSLPVVGLGPQDSLELDGTRASAGPVRLLPGLHHVRVWRHDRVVLATFTEVVSEQQALSLAVPALVPCSSEDLESAASTPRGVTCRRWAKVAPEGAGISVTLCERDRCSRPVHWEQQEARAFAPIAIERRGLPSWAGFAIAGATTLAATGLVLWQAGAFERGRPTSASWEYGGLNPQGMKF